MSDREEIEFVISESPECDGMLYFDRDTKKLTFTGDMDKSAEVFFREIIQPMIDDYMKSVRAKSRIRLRSDP